MAGELGCGAHRAFIATRGGGSLLAELPYDTLTVDHRLNDVGLASVTINADQFPRCEAILGDVEPWEHELHVFRQDVGADVLDFEPWWAGPLSVPQWERTQATFGARDLFTWLEKRDLPVDRSFTATDLALIFEDYTSDALGQDTSPDIALVHIADTGILGDRSVTGASSTRAADALRELGRSGVFWAVWGRLINFGGEPLPGTPICTLYDVCVDQPVLTKQGPNMATRVTVNGGTIPGTSATAQGTAGGIDVRHGLVQNTVSESTILDNASCTAAAVNRLNFLNPAPRYLSLNLLPSAPVAFSDLLPGSRIDVALEIGLRTEVDAFRLQQVTVAAGGQNGTETVSLTLVPLFVPQGGQ